MLQEIKFKAIVALIASGVSDDMIMESQKINRRTLDNIKAARGDYEEYRKIHGEMVRKANMSRKPRQEETKPPQTVSHEHSVTIVANHYMAEELRKQTKYLEIISNKLAFIVEELTGTPARKENENESTL